MKERRGNHTLGTLVEIMYNFFFCIVTCVHSYLKPHCQYGIDRIVIYHFAPLHFSPFAYLVDVILISLSQDHFFFSSAEEAFPSKT